MVIGFVFSCCKDKNQNKKIMIIEPSFNRHGMTRCDAG